MTLQLQTCTPLPLAAKKYGVSTEALTRLARDGIIRLSHTQEGDSVITGNRSLPPPLRTQETLIQQVVGGEGPRSPGDALQSPLRCTAMVKRCVGDRCRSHLPTRYRRGYPAPCVCRS